MVEIVEPEKSERKGRKTRFSFKRFFFLLFIFFVISSIISSISYTYTPKIAVVPIKGVILSDSENSLINGESSSSREISSILRSLRDDDSVKGVLLDINSPGGSAVASEEIENSIKLLKEVKPVYAVVGDIGASGAFWVLSASNKTYSSSLSILGSIGVTMASLSFENFIKEYNISYRKLTSGKFKDIGSPFREMKEEEKELIQEILDKTHSKFIKSVAENRNLSVEKVNEIADGRIFLGEFAMDYGFIDEIGGYYNALDDLKNITSSPDALIVTYGKSSTILDELGIKNLNPISNQFGVQFKY